MTSEPTATSREELDSVVIRFAGDSGDGMQLTGTQFSQTSAVMGNDLATFPDYPSEIRAPAGTTYGVSGFQVHFADHDILTPGDAPDVLVAMNPAALKVNLDQTKRGGVVVVNTGAFTPANIKKAGYTANPLEDGSLAPYRVIEIDISKRALQAAQPYNLGAKAGGRTKNMWTLGLMFWIFGRDRNPTISWLREKFAKKPDVAEANVAALNAGHAYGETMELPQGMQLYQVRKAKLSAGEYRTISGNEALAYGLVVGAQKAHLELFYGSYPITPASSLLHTLAKLKNFGVVTFQAEDEIAAVAAAVGASFGGALGVTGTSGPGVALKTEAIGLAIGVELPLVIVNVQRGGPSTGLPTKTEQSDLLQAVMGRNGDSPLVVLACSSPGDAFYMAIEATRLATKYMTPVMLLSDGFIANGAEPWKLPDLESIEEFPVTFRTEPEGFQPYARHEQTLARDWVRPGTPKMQHRIGGLERADGTGNVSYDPKNHARMTEFRAAKIARVADDIPAAKVDLGADEGEVLLVGWGGTFGALHQATEELIEGGRRVSHLHLRNLWPLPRGLDEVLSRFDQVIVAELNGGMLVKLLRAEYLVDASSYSKVQGQPFTVCELVTEIERRLSVTDPSEDCGERKQHALDSHGHHPH